MVSWLASEGRSTLRTCRCCLKTFTLKPVASPGRQPRIHDRSTCSSRCATIAGRNTRRLLEEGVLTTSAQSAPGGPPPKLSPAEAKALKAAETERAIAGAYKLRQIAGLLSELNYYAGRVPTREAEIRRQLEKLGVKSQ